MTAFLQQPEARPAGSSSALAYRRLAAPRPWRGSSPHSVLGIDWTGSTIAVVQMTLSRGKPALQKRFFTKWPEHFSPLGDQAVAGAWLREQIVAHGLDLKPVIVSVPRRDTVLRLIEVPTCPPNELDAMVRMQVQARSSVDLQDLYLDYLPQRTKSANGNLHVLTVTVPRVSLNVISAVIGAAGLTIMTFGVGELALSALSGQSQWHGTSLDVLANRKKMELVLLRDGIPVASHSEPIRPTNLETIPALIALINRLRQGLPDTMQFDHIEKVRLMGPNASALQTVFAECCQAQVEIVQTPCPDSVRLFAMYDALFQAPVHLDFLHSRSDSENASVRRPAGRALMLLAAATLAIVAGGVSVHHRLLDQQLATLVTNKNELDRRLTQSAQLTNDLAQLAAWDAPADWARTWHQFSQHLPDSQRAYLNNLHWSVDSARRASIRAAGVAQNSQTVLAMHRGLWSSNFALEPSEIPRNDDPDYPRSFQIRAAEVSVSNSIRGARE